MGLWHFPCPGSDGEGKDHHPGKAVAKMTSAPAARLKLKDRGLLKAGYKADLVPFD